MGGIALNRRLVMNHFHGSIKYIAKILYHKLKKLLIRIHSMTKDIAGGRGLATGAKSYYPVLKSSLFHSYIVLQYYQRV